MDSMIYFSVLLVSTIVFMFCKIPMGTTGLPVNNISRNQRGR